MHQILIISQNKPTDSHDLKVIFSNLSPQTQVNLKAMLSAKSPLITKAIPGFWLSHDSFGITCISFEQDKYEAYQVFAGKLLQTAASRKWIKNAANSRQPQSEKYRFRIWLNQLGLKGREYASTRKILTQNLSGSSAYPSHEKMQAYNLRRREACHAGKNTDPHAFILL